MTEFTAPGPGAWRRLADHFPRALTPEYQLIYAETCPPGMAAYMERYGVLARTLDVGYVHGHLYVAPVPLAGASACAVTAVANCWLARCWRNSRHSSHAAPTITNSKMPTSRPTAVPNGRQSANAK